MPMAPMKGVGSYHPLNPFIVILDFSFQHTCHFSNRKAGDAICWAVLTASVGLSQVVPVHGYNMNAEYRANYLTSSP